MKINESSMESYKIIGNNCFVVNCFPPVLPKTIEKAMTFQRNFRKSLENHCSFNAFPPALQETLKNHWDFNDFRPKTMKTISFLIIFNEFCLRPPSGLHPEILFCPVRRPAPACRDLFLSGAILFRPVRGS